jgi:membrane protein YqaA with SNARE-associated domain
MKDLIRAIEVFAQGLGGPGLFLIAYLDSSFLSFPQANDLLIVWMVLKHKALMPYYAGLATLGSVSGCLTLYFIARKGGETLLRKRFHERHVDSALAIFRKYGALAIVVPSLLPPPAPFKMFVLLAGVAEVPVLKFALAIAGGRGLRYFGLGLLTVWYGDAAVGFLRAHGRAVWIGVIVLCACGVALFLWRRRAVARRPA